MRPMKSVPLQRYKKRGRKREIRFLPHYLSRVYGAALHLVCVAHPLLNLEEEPLTTLGLIKN